jgi:phospholipid transport system substrate-binding protein
MNTLLLGRRGIIAATAAAFLLQAPRARAENPVLAPVNQLIQGLLKVMKAGHSASFTERSNMLGPVIDQTFDLTTILKESVGFTWQSLPADQQAALEQAFRRYTVSSYVNSFDEYNGQRFQVNPETRTVGDDEVVRTRIIPTSGDGHNLDYVMHEGPQGWRIVDVLADGAISRVAVQRSDFRGLIRRGGAPALAESLATKSASLAG